MPHHFPRRARRLRTFTIIAATAVVAVTTVVPSAPAAGAGSRMTVAPMAAASGEAMPVGNLPGWRQTFTDDFNTDVPLGQFPAAVSSKWDAYPSPWKDTTGFGTYSPSKVVSISNGVLNQYIHTEDGTSMVSALLPQVPGSGSSRGQLYGRYAVRFRADALAGYKLAWMLWPDSNQSLDGEIDFPEKNIDSSNVWAFMHHRDSTGSADQDWFKSSIDITSWHTAVIEWRPNLVVFIYDGQEMGRTTDRVPNTPMHWVLQTEVSITSGAKPPASVSGNVQVAWAAAWAYDPSITSGGSSGDDGLAPAVRLGAPTDNATASGVVTLSATATDDSGIDEMKWFVDGVEVGYDGSGSTWTDSWASDTVSNGPHRLFAKARDNAGNWGTSAAVTVMVDNS